MVKGGVSEKEKREGSVSDRRREGLEWLRVE
jgi:hypothetical protein